MTSMNPARIEAPVAEQSCKHPTKISACGIKVCMDCGAPLNAKARVLAALKGRGA